MKKIDDILVAITFAEAGEYEAAGEALDERHAGNLMESESSAAAYESA